MKLMDEKVPHYLTALDGYINTCYKGKLLSNEILLELAHKGLRIAKSTKSYNWIFLNYTFISLIMKKTITIILLRLQPFLF